MKIQQSRDMDGYERLAASVINMAYKTLVDPKTIISELDSALRFFTLPSPSLVFWSDVIGIRPNAVVDKIAHEIERAENRLHKKRATARMDGEDTGEARERPTRPRKGILSGTLG